MQIKKIVVLPLFFLTLLFPVFLFAAEDDTSQATDSQITSQLSAFAGKSGANLGTPNDPRKTAALLINSVLRVLGILFVIYLVYGGARILLSRGEEEKIKTGQAAIRNAIIGLAIILSAYGITRLVSNILLDKKTPQTYEPCIERSLDRPEDILADPNAVQQAFPYCDEL